jgi:hypothetical protein
LIVNEHGVIHNNMHLHTHGLSDCKSNLRSLGQAAKCLLAAVTHVEEAVLVLVRVVYTSHQASCGYKLHTHSRFQVIQKETDYQSKQNKAFLFLFNFYDEMLCSIQPSVFSTTLLGPAAQLRNKMPKASAGTWLTNRFYDQWQSHLFGAKCCLQTQTALFLEISATWTVVWKWIAQPACHREPGTCTSINKVVLLTTFQYLKRIRHQSWSGMESMTIKHQIHM